MTPISEVGSADQDNTHAPITLTRAQAQGLERLEQLTLVGGSGSYAGFKLRNRALIIGASGSGKTQILQTLSQRLELPLFCCNTGSWIVFGAGTRQHTLKVCRDFIRHNDGGIFFLDELDKSLPSGSGVRSSSWSQAVFGEIIALLDGQRLDMMGWDVSDVEKLTRNFTVHAAGAWQHLVMDARRRPQQGPLGFGANAKNAAPSYLEKVLADDAVPQEILYRFHPQPIFIPVPTEDDFRTALLAIHQSLGVTTTAVDGLMSQAIYSGMGMRWVEGYITDLVVRQPELRQKGAKAAPRATKRSPRKISIELGTDSAEKVARWIIDLRILLRSWVSRRVLIVKSLEEYPNLRGCFARQQPKGKTIGMLCYALASSLAPLEARELRLETLSLMEDLYDLIANVIDHHPVELERCGLLKDLAELAELLDRIWQTAQALHTEGTR